MEEMAKEGTLGRGPMAERGTEAGSGWATVGQAGSVVGTGSLERQALEERALKARTLS